MLIEALQVIKNNVTESGIAAATSGPVSNGHREYLHVWPRDAILCALEWIDYEPQKAYDSIEAVCKLQLNDAGLFYQRYEFDGKPDEFGWTNSHGNYQIDQDALMLVGASKLPKNKLNDKLNQTIYLHYLNLIKYIEKENTATDVWEQKRGYFFYTTSALIWGLECAEVLFENEKLSPNHFKIKNKLIESLTGFYNKPMNAYVKSPEEPIMDLEVILGLVILNYTSVAKNNEKFLLNQLNSLFVFENELMVKVGSGAAPIRYDGDFWNGEIVGASGIGRPWPMGTCLLSSAYSLAAMNSKKMNSVNLYNYCINKSKINLELVKRIPHANKFVEQIDKNEFVPANGPVGLSWAASEYLRAIKLHQEAKK